MAPIPSDIVELDEEGLKSLWHEAKLRGRGYSRARVIVDYAKKSVGLTGGTDAGRESIKWFVEQIIQLDEQLAEIENVLHQKCMEIPHAENILEIQNYLSALRISDDILYYLIHLCEATRQHPLVELGISPRGVGALTRMAKAWAILKDRSYVIPEDVQEVFTDVCAHRLILKPQARLEGISEKEILQDILKETKPLKDPKRWNA